MRENTDLIGRDDELADVIERIGERRLVTIIGAGGIGKTTLAQAAADRIADRFPLGSHLVDLTRVDCPDDVGGAIATQLGFPSFPALIASPTESPALVVIDNCEHVIDAAAAAIGTLLESCATPTVLATSRSPLDIDGESVLVLGPLGVPSAGDGGDSDADSVRMFLERARHAGSSPAGDELHAVTELCRKLDGVPLAIELAAARTRSMTPTEIIAHLRLGDDVLSRPRFRGAERHRSLRHTIDWSLLLLDDTTAAVFDRLAVFAGPFTFEMAHAVGADPVETSASTRDAVDRLVDASLLVAEGRGADTWYRMLSPIRRSAMERLTASGTLPAVEDKFVDHTVATCLGLIDATSPGWSTAAFRQLLSLYDNLAAALRWCLDRDDTLDRAGVLYGTLWGAVHQAHTDDIATLGRAVLKRWPDPTQPTAPDVAATLATAEYLLGRPEVAIAIAEKAMPHAASSRFAPVSLHRVLGQAARALGDVDTAITMFTAAAAHATRNGLLGLAMEAEVFRAQVLADMGRTDEALAIARRVHGEALAADADMNANWARSTEGHILLRCATAEAIPVVTEALDAARDSGPPIVTSANLRSLALALAVEGRIIDAAAAVVELIDALLNRGALWSGRIVLDVAAVVLHRAGRDTWKEIDASARALPVTVLMSGPGYEPFPLPPHDGTALERRAAIALAHRELSAVIAGQHPPVPADAGPEAGDQEEDPAGVGWAVGEEADGVEAVEEQALFIRSGAMWEVRYAGRTAHLPASKGMNDLAALLASPDREIHSLDLAGARFESTPADVTVDDQARRQYRQRVRELQADIETAELDHDLARAEQARIELDAILEHLGSALGLTGRARRSGGSAERARSAVTKRLRATIQRIAGEHPALGRHLDVSVTTGSYCRYRPDRAVRWRVES